MTKEERKKTMFELGESSEMVRRGIIARLQSDWEERPVENQIRYLQFGCLVNCYVAGVEVPQKLLDAAGIEPDEVAEAKAEAERVLALPPETEEFKHEKMRRHHRGERERWDSLSYEEKLNHVREYGLDLVAHGIVIPDDILEATGKSKERYEWARQMARQMKYFPHEDVED